MDCPDQLLFEEDRVWSPDHASIVFSARSGDRQIRFFLPRACLTSLAIGCPASQSSFFKLFDHSLDVLEEAARALFARNHGFNSSYVLTEEAIEAAQADARFEAPKLAA